MNLYIKLILAISLLSSFSAPVFAAVLESFKHQDNKIVLTTDEGNITVEYLTNDSVYIHYLLNKVKQLPGYLVDGNLEANSLTQIVDRDHSLSFFSESSTVIIQKSPVKLSFYHKGKLLLAEEQGYFEEGNFEQQKIRGFRFQLNDKEKLFGGGQRVLGMDRRGKKLPLYNKAHYGYEDHAPQMNYSLPGLMSSSKYILMFDNSAKGNLDLGATEKDILQFDAIGGRTAYLVAMSESYESLVNQYTTVTGKQPLPPIWAFGNIASRFGYRSEAQARDVVAEYHRQKMPLDAIIFDLYWFGSDMKGFMGNLDWDRKTFPNGEQMVEDFDNLGVNTILISEPFILTTSNNWQSGADAGAFSNDKLGKPVTFDFYFGNTSLVDVFSEKGQQWFWSFYQKQLDWGVAGFWGDLGEPEVHPQEIVHQISQSNQTATADEVHNVYGHQWAKNLFNGHSAANINKRPFIMMRSGFAGSQRYGLIPWTGDVGRSWAALKSQVELSLQMGLLGLGYTHSDLGGFAVTDNFDPELYVRWLQFGTFQPIFRPHSQEQIAPEPIFHGEEVASLIKEALSWRYQLLPYNYSLAYQNHTRGTPFMRPTFFHNEREEHSLSDNSLFESNLLDTDAFFWGPNLLVLPVTEPEITELEYTLPKGTWFDYWSDKKYLAGKQKLPVEKRNIPVLVKGGAIIPHAPKMLNTREYTGDELIVHYWFDPSVAQSNFQLYQDDGLSKDYQKGKFTLLDFNAKATKNEVGFSISIQGKHTKLKRDKQIKIVVHNAVSFDQAYQGSKRLTSQFDKKSKILTVDLSFDGTPLELRFK